MKAINNKAKKEITVKMTYGEYINIKRILQNVCGVGAGYISTEQTKFRGISIKKIMLYDEEIDAAFNFPIVQL